jgi:O-antigen ligase/polysaccharide polymerase Wzy-like membrane protein
MALSTEASALHPAAYAPRFVTSVERLRCGLLWLTGFAGAFAFVEPSPYEVASLLAMIVFAITGLTLRPAIMPLVMLLILYNVGFSIAVVPVIGEPKTLLWVFVSWYMSITAMFFAAMLCANTEQRLNLLVKGYTVAALVACLAGIVGYFQVVPRLSELFLLFGRARGTFNDPNVLGAFVVFPALVGLQRVLAGRLPDVIRGGTMLTVLVVGLFLSFSRAAWGQFALAAAVMLFLMFVTSRSAKERLRIVIIAAVGFAVLALFITALLSIGQVAELFKERATLDQSYDTGQTGRFGRHLLGFMLALDTPFGIGPLQFVRIFPEDPHNSYLNAFMSGGWLSGFCYLTLVLLTLVKGFRFVFARTPWRSIYIAVYAAFVGVAGESLLIDSDHWRHYFLLLGVLWGLMAASWHHQRSAAPPHGAAGRPLAPATLRS